MKNRRQFLQYAGLIAAGMTAGCGRRTFERAPSTTKPVPKPIHAIATTPILAELLTGLMGEMGQVTSLLSPGLPLGSLKRTGTIEAQLISSDLVVTLGFGLEAGLGPSVTRAADAGAVVCELASAFPADRLFPSVTDPTQKDIHVWLDPNLWLEATRPLVTALCGLRPEATDEFVKHGHASRFDLEELGNELRHRAEIAVADDATRTIKTRNAALRYLGRAAGVGVEVGDPGPLFPAHDDLESAVLDTLTLDTEKIVARADTHDLSTSAGLCTWALDLMLLRFS